MIGIEARALGGDVILAPTMNVLTHPRWGRAQETYSEDPFLIGSMAVGFIEGAQQHVIATAKHYAVNNIENTRLEVNVTVDERTLREIYLPHFRRAVLEAQVGAVMSAYNQVNGSYCSENDHLLRNILVKLKGLFKTFKDMSAFFCFSQFKDSSFCYYISAVTYKMF